MPLSEVEILAGVQLGDGAAGEGPFLSILGSADPEFNVETISQIPAGHTHPVYTSAIGETVGIPFAECAQIVDLLSALGNFGADVSVSKLFYRLVENIGGLAPIDVTGADAGAAVHTVFTANKVLGYIQSISAGDRKQAMASGKLLPVKDGANPALVRVGAGHITSDPVGDQYFTLGSIVYPGGVVLPGCDDFQVDFNPVIRELSDESNIDTAHSSLRGIKPMVNFTTSFRGAYELRNTEVTNFKVHLRRGKNASDLYGDLETQHIRLTIPKGLFVVEKKGGGDESRYSCRIEPVGNLANGWVDSPLTWDVNVAVNNT